MIFIKLFKPERGIGPLYASVSPTEVQMIIAPAPGEVVVSLSCSPRCDRILFGSRMCYLELGLDDFNQIYCVRTVGQVLYKAGIIPFNPQKRPTKQILPV